jgi:hypothetical protein
MESVLKEINTLSDSLRKRKQIIHAGSNDDLSPHVESVVNRGQALVADASDAQVLAWVTALASLRRAHEALRKEFRRYNRTFSSYTVPQLRKEDFFPDPPGGPTSAVMAIEAHEKIQDDAAFKRAKLGLSQLQEQLSAFLNCSSVARILERNKLEAKVATAKALENVLEELQTEKEWHPLDILDLEELRLSLGKDVKVAEEALATPTASTPGAAGFGPYFWNTSTILASSTATQSGSNGPAGPGVPPGTLNLPPAPPPVNPNVTAVNLPTTAVATPVLPGPGPSSTSTPNSQPSVPSGPTQFPTGALYANWYQDHALKDLPVFTGKIAEYLEWREVVVPLLNQDTRGAIHSFKTLKPLLQGNALDKIAHIRATNPDAVAEVFRTLDEAYLDPKLLIDEINKALE